MGLWYTTREQVKRAAQINGPDSNPSIDRLLESASREVEDSLNRWFYPLTAIRYYPYPSTHSPTAYRYWLNADLIEVTTLVSGGVTIAPADYFKEPVNYGPPYNRIEIDLASSAAFQAGATWQQALAVTGRWGYCEDSIAAGALAEADDGTETALDVTDSSLIGVGDLILVGTERMIVTEKTLIATGAIIATTALTADESNTTVVTSSGASCKQGETVTIDAERMLIESISGNNLAVKRAYDGSVLASHNIAAVIYAPRTLTVERHAVGTTAAAHNIAATITKNVPPGLISELCLAEVIYGLTQEKGSFALTAGQGEAIKEISGKGIADVRKRASDAYGRTRGPRAI